MILDVLLPVDCPACEAPARGGLCAACGDDVPTLLRPITPPPGLATAWVLDGYDGPLGAWIRRGKYRSDPSAFVAMGALLASAAAGRLPRVEAVVSAPVPWRRRLTRGFDQAALLAEAVGCALSLPHLSLLRRIDGTEQATRSRRQRVQGARASFAHSGAPTPQRILLVDDVITSGATARACAEELLCAGARRVHLLCLVSAD